jgi:hypothetical protein
VLAAEDLARAYYSEKLGLDVMMGTEGHILSIGQRG